MDTIYGKFSVETVVRLPEDRILGARIRRSAMDKVLAVEIQLHSLGRIAQLEMDLPNAMFLLSVLKSIQLDTGFPLPDDPRMSGTKQ